MNILLSATGTHEIATGTGTSPVILFYIFILVAAAGIIILQVFLSKKESKWPGLILPIISFGISLLATLAILLFSVNKGTMAQTINGEIVEQTVTQINSISSIIGGTAFVFVLCNIPTGILIAIYAASRGKRKRQRDLEKMSVQDLE